MNDVRNLMSKLRGDLEYREFDNSTPGKPAGGWALLERARSVAALEPAEAAAPAPEGEPPMATQLRKAADARSQRGLGAAGRLSLGQYAPAQRAPELPSPAGLPLSEVFARLARSA